jgi:hypothetical protein
MRLQPWQIHEFYKKLISRLKVYSNLSILSKQPEAHEPAPSTIDSTYIAQVLPSGCKTVGAGGTEVRTPQNNIVAAADT